MYTITECTTLRWQAGLLDGIIAVYNVSSHETSPQYDTMYVASAFLLLVFVIFGGCEINRRRQNGVLPDLWMTTCRIAVLCASLHLAACYWLCPVLDDGVCQY